MGVISRTGGAGVGVCAHSVSATSNIVTTPKLHVVHSFMSLLLLIQAHQDDRCGSPYTTGAPPHRRSSCARPRLWTEAGTYASALSGAPSARSYPWQTRWSTPSRRHPQSRHRARSSGHLARRIRGELLRYLDQHGAVSLYHKALPTRNRLALWPYGVAVTRTLA